MLFIPLLLRKNINEIILEKMSVVGFDFGSQTSFCAIARQGGIEVVANEYSKVLFRLLSFFKIILASHRNCRLFGRQAAIHGNSRE